MKAKRLDLSQKCVITVIIGVIFCYYIKYVFSYDGVNPADTAREIRDAYGTKILSIAVEGEDGIDMNNLIEISGNPDDVFKVNNYANLTAIVKKLTDQIKYSCQRMIFYISCIICCKCI